MGRDGRGRRQYRYHALWQQIRDETKYERTIAFAHALPRLRRRVERDLRRRGLPREKVVAAVVRLLEMTLIRVGNEEYARDNRSFGLTTLRDRHAQISTRGLKLTFRGKSGKLHEVGLRDRRLARVVRACQELPGQRLFQYVDDDGRAQSIDSDDVNDYLRQAMGDDFSAKDFRTWAGTVLAARALRDASDAEGGKSANATLVRAVASVASQLGNTPAVCRRCYIHPAVLESYVDGSFESALSASGRLQLARGATALRADERFALGLLQRRRPAGRAA
jgi:DNA topoisomerase-1